MLIKMGQNMAPKLYLFDIDGTLLSTHGIPRKAMGRVLMNRYEHFFYDELFNFSGRTDWEIVEHLLEYGQVKYNDRLVHDILHAFSLELRKELQNGQKPLVFPGVHELLQILSKESKVYLGLVTGNIKDGANSKLEFAELNGYFPVGGFGNDARERNKLPPIAILRSEDYYNIKVDKNDVWIIGDSIYDVQCAQKNNLRCLAVCTGWTGKDKLLKVKPEFLVENFANVEEILKILLLR
jgi:phosphoglycolate phosphatase